MVNGHTTVTQLYSFIHTDASDDVESLLMSEYGELISSLLTTEPFDSLYVIRALVDWIARQTRPPDSNHFSIIKRLPSIIIDIGLLTRYFEGDKGAFTQMCVTYQGVALTKLDSLRSRLPTFRAIDVGNDIHLLLSHTFRRLQLELDKLHDNPPRYMPLPVVLRRHARLAFGQFVRDTARKDQATKRQRKMTFTNSTAQAMSHDAPDDLLCNEEVSDIILDALYQADLSEDEKLIFSEHVLNNVAFTNIQERLNGPGYSAIRRRFEAACQKIRRHLSLHYSDLYRELKGSRSCKR